MRLFPLNPRTGLPGTLVGTTGEVAGAAFLVAALSGAALAVPFDPAHAFVSLATLILANPPGVFFRNLHYWAGQVCFLFTLLHFWEHLAAGTEKRVGRGVWARLTLSVPILVYLMLSGFLLRGDADAMQALRIVREALIQVPWMGRGLATFLLGTGERLDVIYIQHAATATILTWLFIIEHVRKVWPRMLPLAGTLGSLVLLSLFVSPGLHDGVDPVVKGPWYFLGLQEILHWTPQALLSVFFALGLLIILFLTREVPARWSLWLKRGLLAVALLYGGLTLIGAFLRGEHWAFTRHWPVTSANLRLGFIFRPQPVTPIPLPVVLGRPEGCLVCHTGVSGLGNAHRPEAIGCVSCHGGDPLTLDAKQAHARMESIPGSLATASLRCGQTGCHGAQIPRVERSVMTTLRGVIEVDRTVFGEPSGAPAHVLRLGHSPADTHLRQLCAPCHLGAPKQLLGPLPEDEQGGGCLACHLSYGPEAQAALNRYEAQRKTGRAEPPRVHPSLSLQVDNGKCFGCHSRSGRISTSYEGWHERHASEISSGARTRTLADGRTLMFIQADVHHTRGMDCIDCHTSQEVMGDGGHHARKRDQQRLACEDCHRLPGQPLSTVPAAKLDPESRRLLAQRPWGQPPPPVLLRTRRGDALVNSRVDPISGVPVLIGKRSGQVRPLKAALSVCREGGHREVSCGSCHTKWTPRCNTCHTGHDPATPSYDWVADAEVLGAWKESGSDFRADLPTLGVQQRGSSRTVETFAPGMIFTLKKHAASQTFHRRFARVEPHTTQRSVRSCESCHNDPVALGYGTGTLKLARGKDGVRWIFNPTSAAGPDGLPMDAWIPFLGQPKGPVSTRDDVRPFTPAEQRRMLTVGACLTCHAGTSSVMRQATRDFARALARRRTECVVPVW